MIEAFSLRNAHLFGDALASQSQLRYRVFIEQAKLQHLYFENMEYDEFDTPSAVYLVWRDSDRVVRGLIRLLRTDRPYMLQSYWPHLVKGEGPLPSPHIWETTRVCVDPNIDIETRVKILPELLCAVSEFFKTNGIEAMVGVTRPKLLGYFIKTGVHWLGDPDCIEGHIERAFYVPTEFIRPAHLCEKYGVSQSVLYFPGTATKRVAA